MTGWPQARLGDVAEFRYGKALPGKSRTPGRVPVYGSNGATGQHDSALVEEPTIIVGRKGSVGAVHQVKEPCFPIDTTYYVLRKQPDLLDLDFLYLALVRLDLARLRTATGVPGLNRDDAYREQIPLPPLDQQRRIVDILNRANGIQRLRREALAKARQLIPALFIDMFGDPASNPKGWPVVTLGSLIAEGPQNGLYRPGSDYGEGTPIVRINSFYDGQITRLHKLRRLTLDAKTVGKYALHVGDILINRVNSRPFLGKSAIVSALLEPTVFESNMMRLAVDRSRIDPRYVIIALQHRHAREQLLARAKDAINQSSINQSDVRAVRLQMPPVTAQNAFAERVADIQATIAQQERMAEASEQLVASLMAQFFEGGSERQAA